MTKPFVKWVGGKTKLLPELLARLPSDFKERTYHEPFMGGAALFFATHEATGEGQRHVTQSWLSDINADLVLTYRALQEQPESLIDELREHELCHCGDHYYTTRSQFNGPADWKNYERAAAFVYLNKTCFNGVYRVNSEGRFNVPMGRYANPKILDVDALREARRVLLCAFVTHEPFENALERAGAESFSYLDPPYDPLSETSSFTTYATGGFTRRDQVRLRDACAAIDRRGGLFMLSNSDTPLTRELYRDFNIEEVRAPRSINSKATKRGCVGEILVRNYQ